MSQSSRKRRRQENEPQNYSPQVVVQKKPRLQTSRKTLKRDLTTVEESGEDENVESQKIRELIRATASTKESDDFATKFQATVQTDKKKFVQHIESYKKMAKKADMQFQDHIKACISSFGIPLNNPGLLPSHKAQVDDARSLLDTASWVIEASRKVESDYNVLIAATKAAEKELKENDNSKTLEGDKKEVARLLESGMKLSLRRIERLLPEDMQIERQPAMNLSSEFPYNEASRYFVTTRRDDKRLRENLHQARKGVKSMVRCLPKQDEV